MTGRHSHDPPPGVVVTEQDLILIHCRCALGLSRKRLAELLDVPPATIRTRVQRLFRRLGYSGQEGFDRICYEYGRIRERERLTGAAILPLWEPDPEPSAGRSGERCGSGDSLA